MIPTHSGKGKTIEIVKRFVVANSYVGGSEEESTEDVQGSETILYNSTWQMCAIVHLLQSTECKTQNEP